MIVNMRPNDRLELIYQPAHAAMAAQIAARWRWDSPPRRWWLTLIAIAQHDNGWVESELAPNRTSEGRPCNFTERTTEEAIGQWRRGVARGVHQDRWIGLLIARHAWRLYAPNRGEEAVQDEWLDELAAQQAAWRAALGVSEAELAQADALMRWSDWCSLALCWRRLPESGEPFSLGEGPDGRRYEIRAVEAQQLTVDPWPFDVERFDLTVESRTLPQPRFATPSALQSAIANATVEPRQWAVVR
ncbi:MAG: DUF3891 family protein [Anaerolineales bacterium]|nr:DUF3891 family protein [Anaerolineales bacterium]MCB9127981.1 DUF3891 family protein [Ardenticatenales bacterium]MCB9171997.1 DUF3891 family protein [Ardenticatenales bacterium]